MTIEIRVRKGTNKNGKPYHCVLATVNERTSVLTFDKRACERLLNLAPSDFDNLAQGEYIIMKGDKTE